MKTSRKDRTAHSKKGYIRMKGMKASSFVRRNLLSLLVLFLMTVTISACSQQDSGKTIATMEARIAEMQGTVEALKARGTAEASISRSDPKGVTPTPIGRLGRVSMVPIAIETRGPTDGWISYDVTLALVNDSARIASFTFDNPSATIETQEGYHYEGTVYSDYVINNMQILPIPPGFRVRGFSYSEQSYHPSDPHYPMKLVFAIAATSHPLRATIKQIGDIDVTHIVSLQFPAERVSQEFADLGLTVQIKNKGALTFGDVSVGVEDPNNPQYLGVLIETRFKNSDPGYDTGIQGKCYMFDGDGWIYNAYLEDKSGKGGVGGFRAGPGQETRGQIIVRLGQAVRLSDLKYPPKLENAKLYCSIEGTDVILNLPTMP